MLTRKIHLSPVAAVVGLVMALAAVGSNSPSAYGQTPLGSLLAPLQNPSGSANVRAELLADVAAVAPGESFHVAVRLAIAEGWHIYWKNPGGPGLPTRIQLDLPAGFVAEPTQYPVPSKFTTPPDIQSYGYENQAVFVVPVTPPETLVGSHVTILASANWLECKDLCAPGEARLQLRLPVLQDGAAKPPPANTKLFARAMGELPQRADRVRGLKFWVYLSFDRVRPGASVVAAVVLEAAPGFQFARWGEPAAVAELFLEKTEGLTFGDPAYEPADQDATQKVVIRIPVEVAAELGAAELTIRGLVKYRLTEPGGSELPARGVEFEIPVPVAGAGATVKAAHPELFGTARPAERGRPGTAGLLDRLGLVGLLLACALYGLGLNATPCVLPIVSIKVVSFIQQGRQRSGRAAALGLSFGAGVLLLFVVLGVLATAGRNLLQFPEAVIALGAIVMALALSMLGVYTLRPPTLAGELDAKMGGESLAGSFGKGLLAPVLGFACTGPLLAGAFAWATQQAPATAVAAFVAAGVGMAAPYVLLSAFPGWLRMLPKPGAWMITFERVVGFGLLGAVVWLLHPLQYQIGPAGLEWTLVFLVAVGAGCWLAGKGSLSGEAKARWGYRAAAAGVVVVAGVAIYGFIYPVGQAKAEQARGQAVAAGPTDFSRTIPWQVYSPEGVATAVGEGKPVFVEFTAAYCTVCKVNLKLHLDTPAVRAKMKELGVVPFRGDFTTYDEQIAKMLQHHGRAGVPLYLVYKPHEPDRPEVLPTTISEQKIINALDRAASGPKAEPTW